MRMKLYFVDRTESEAQTLRSERQTAQKRWRRNFCNKDLVVGISKDCY